MIHRLYATGLATLAAAVLAGCGSTVKLDETPVESRTPATGARPGGSGNVAAGGGGTAAGTTPQSQVASVDLGRTPGGAGAGGAGGLGGADDLAKGRNGRVVYFDFDSFVVKDEFRGLVETHAKGPGRQPAAPPGGGGPHR